MPPAAFQFTENCGMLTLPPSPYVTELDETLILGILGLGIVIVMSSNADLTALAADCASVETVVVRLCIAVCAFVSTICHEFPIPSVKPFVKALQ